MEAIMSDAAERRGRNEVPAPRATRLITRDEVYDAGAHLYLGSYFVEIGVKLPRKIPVIPNIDALILEHIEANPSLFCMGGWHIPTECGTMHCRAGWAVTLAGKSGRLLELDVGPAAAGELIYIASRPGEPIPDFFCDAETALADIRACAAKQLAGASS